MVQVRMVSRILVVLVIAACSSRPYNPGGSTQPFGGGCASGSSNPQAPIVCVDDTGTTLSVDPDPVRPDDVQGGVPINLVWKTKSGGGDLRIEMKSNACVKNLNCNGNGQCTSQVIRASTATCKYDVWIQGGTQPRLDPTVVIQPCCGG